MLDASGGKIGSLRQKSVPRMDRITPIRFSHRQDAFGIQIRTRANPLEAVGFVGDSSVQTLLIVLGKYRHRRYPQVSGRSSYTYRNFTAISDQQSLYRHVGSTSPKELAILARNEGRRIRSVRSPLLDRTPFRRVFVYSPVSSQLKRSEVVDST